MPKKSKKSIAKYEDVSGQFSNKTLFQSFWFVKHKLIIRKIGIALLGFWGASSVLFSVVVFGEYIIWILGRQSYVHGTSARISKFCTK